ncbi:MULTISPECIES: methionyl-tRNA formyltransferase [unclassified Rhodanobacter]|uniref:methionyl-tRNA formyltransferase n=1 Tax=unclassified Rhodanobacter TaxID=2621553 RepID=UPI001BE0F2D8|nr:MULTISPECIES: methionyl-tRNA formyltransferase [unclassified Rhodanobacter]MBT2143924.1 methionyl-tRNA formyltransferase [Rhodanobacter sp. LX-99]MBT2147002.1 methionyl-tRNA formyltransferase [Rhodanobacter sp. LX-100]
MRLVFAGTPEFSVPCLEACRASGAEVVAVYTQPDRPAGRGRKLTPSPVKQAALAAGIAVEQPESLKPADVQQRLADYRPDLLVVVAYGLILPRKVLAIPRLGCWNVHASLLPRWRGAAPIQRAILAGDRESGVDLMQMEAGLDTGPVLLERRTPTSRDDTGGSLHDRLAMLGADVLAEGLRRTLAGETLAATPQPDDGVTYAHKLDKAEARLDFSRPALELERQVRAFDPWPVAEGEIAGEPLRIWAARAIEREHHAAPGSVLATGRDGIDLACGTGALRVTAVQRAGGKRIGAVDYLNARPELRHSR